MTDHPTEFPATRDAALQRLAAFVPAAGIAYAQKRNFDFGPGQHDAVSQLSPYLRVRLLDEVCVIRAVLQAHSRKDAEKFIAEVFWRTYWKGWLELRPTVWTDYQSDLNRLEDDIQTQSGLRARWEEACLGRTGIAPFDAWARELVQTGYLHNHARMWFASIWIFTLELPWQLGADFFLRHLLDGDAASNTLGWRWVAGIQTRGKTYLADPDNIATFTKGRYRDVAGLARAAPPVDAPPNPDPDPLPPITPCPLEGRVGLVLHADDVDPRTALEQGAEPAAWAYADGTARQSPWITAPSVAAFRRAAAEDRAPEGTQMPTLETAEALAAWVKAQDLQTLIAPYAPVGPTQDLLQAYAALPHAVPIKYVRRPLDDLAWPKATKGFFKFKENIPAFIDTFASP